MYIYDIYIGKVCSFVLRRGFLIRSDKLGSSTFGRRRLGAGFLGAGHLGAWTIGRQVFFSFVFL